ncbi:MAG: sulfur carrier protein ThiS [Verrucomicrobiales bacterium]|nr:sulfur carrier protein ThiS [Verrucomicrobiales bacterium]
MKITINGEEREFAVEVDSVPLEELLRRHLELGDAPVLVEQNGKALLKKEFSNAQISEGDVLEIVRMVAGG